MSMIHPDDIALIHNAPDDLKQRFEDHFIEFQSLFAASEYAWQTDIVWDQTEEYLKDILLAHGVDWIHKVI